MVFGFNLKLNTDLDFGFKNNGIYIDPDAQFFFNRLPDSLTQSQKIAISNYFTTIKADNNLTSISEAFDYLYFLGGLSSESNSLINSAKEAFDAIIVNTPSWTNFGFIGRSGNYLNTTFIDSDMSEAYREDDGFLGVFCRTNGTAGATLEIGTFSDTGSFFSSYVSALYTGSEIRGNINLSGNTFFSQEETNGIGLSVVAISGNERKYFRNGVQIFNQISGTDGLPKKENYILAVNYLDDIPLRFSDKQICLAFKGKYSNVNQAKFYTATDTLLRDLGINV